MRAAGTVSQGTIDTFNMQQKTKAWSSTTMPFLLLNLLPLSSGKCIMLDSFNVKIDFERKHGLQRRYGKIPLDLPHL
jgi:hypothetical protein